MEITPIAPVFTPAYDNRFVVEAPALEAWLVKSISFELSDLKVARLTCYEPAYPVDKVPDTRAMLGRMIEFLTPKGYVEYNLYIEPNSLRIKTLDEEGAVIGIHCFSTLLPEHTVWSEKYAYDVADAHCITVELYFETYSQRYN